MPKSVANKISSSVGVRYRDAPFSTSEEATVVQATMTPQTIMAFQKPGRPSPRSTLAQRIPGSIRASRTRLPSKTL
jgi:hypothetical protein